MSLIPLNMPRPTAWIPSEIWKRPAKISNVDVFSIISDESHGYINYLQVSFGAIVRSHTIEIKKKLDEKNESLLQLGIIYIRQLFSSRSKTLFLSHNISLGEKLKVFIPKQGDKKKLVDYLISNLSCLLYTSDAADE